MTDRDLGLLEFHKIREILAGFTSFSASRELALDLVPLSNEEEVRLRLKESAEARRLLSLSPDTHIGEVSDIREMVKMAALGRILPPQSLLEIQKTLSAAHRLKSHLANVSHEVLLLSGLGKDIVALDQLANDIDGCLSPAGELLDTASPKLASVRHRMREVRQELLAHMQAIIASPRGRRIVQEPIITEREGRYVIPVKVESRRQIKGIVHDVSNTEATVFIEPWTTTDTQNELRQLVAEEKDEIERILRTLSAEAGAFEGEITRNIELIAEIDLALAKARYARDAKATEPIIVVAATSAKAEGQEPGGVLRLAEARHPLLKKKAVPLSVEIGRDFSVLVITGPNTGGKTVALKTIGLLSLMAQAGLPIPAQAESRIPVFDGIYADIGDEQSIEQTLSTFSWHIGNIVHIINNATAQSLVLLDELGTNTDPGEGSALGRAILLHFLSERTMTVATTHYTELKALAHSTEGMENAALDVDPVTMAPTYHLTVGIPGGSNALATASRLGLPQDIVTRARRMLSESTQEIESLLTHLVSEQKNVELLRLSLEKELKEAEQNDADLKNRLRQLEEDRQRIIKQTREQISREAAELQMKIREAAGELRKEKSRERIEQAKKALAEAQEKLDAEAWQARPVAGIVETEIDTGPVTAGDTVWLKEAGVPSTVLSVSEERGLVEVQAGKVKMTLRLDSVEKRIPATGEVKTSGAVIKREMHKPRVSLELDLRGKRAEQVEPLLDSYLNEASLSGLSRVRIIHGIGTGTVRQIVREALASHPLVTSFQAGEQGEGGDGVTIVSM
ncbi:MAG: endonuclease MutS2 [Dehalococcoidia bacterium]|nr:endonuclease MutS2 [Dehalococcoidia bacterium]MDH4367788.1 endonuclease MutS2 [Dehalococcoidia bacterium]